MWSLSKGIALRFVVPTREQVAEDAEQRAFLTNYESVPWVCSNHWQGSEFVVNRQVRDSGYLHFPWQSRDHGPLLLSTGTLVEREEPYILALELARGTTHRLRQQMNDWVDQGLRDTGDAGEKLQEAMALFVRAATSQWAPAMAHSLAAESLEVALSVCRDLVNRYVDQVLEVRHRGAKQFNTLFAVSLSGVSPVEIEHPNRHVTPHVNEIVSTFNATAIPCRWREVEVAAAELSWETTDAQFDWCHANGFKVVAGPLAALNQFSIPDWLYLWEGDGRSIASYVGNYVTQVAKRYKKRVHLWHCVASRAADEHLGLSEDERLRIVVTAIESLRSVDEESPLVVSFDQPWGEHLRGDDEGSPWIFADALVRSNLKLSAIGLEFNFGYRHGCSLRDLMEVSRRLDAWSFLGVPIIAFLTMPSQMGATSELVGNEAVQEDVGSLVSPQWQAQLALDMVRLLLAKRTVHGIIWNQWSDTMPHSFPHGGLLDAKGEPKPVLERLKEFRREHLV